MDEFCSVSLLSSAVLMLSRRSYYNQIIEMRSALDRHSRWSKHNTVFIHAGRTKPLFFLFSKPDKGPLNEYYSLSETTVSCEM